ncbi:AAA family ATPase [Ruthenibacterium sp. CLA-JM-H11]|uniref:AAA family ATPase n=1 Tax=Ruthenibacterium intestinale TaxID=3133163 RepID=A0ABV1GD01_9FIRM
MYIHSVKLINFKSIGNYPEAEIILEPKVTAIIGKNESGKSNILDGLSRINFLKANSSAFSAEVVNRNSESGTENIYLITLKPDIKEIANELHTDTLVEISKSHCTVTGGFLDYYLQHVWPKIEAVVKYLDGISANPMQLKDQELTSYRTYKQELLKNEQIDLYQVMSALEFFRTRITKLAAERRKEFENTLSSARDAWSDASGLFPMFFYRKSDKHLNTSYKLDDVEKQLKGPAVAPDSLLYDFVKLIGVSPDDFVAAVRSGSLPKQESLRRRINRLVNDKINTPFRNFYQTETITLDLGFNSGVVSFVVTSEDGEALMLSERSNGLRWYLETFIDAQANDIVGRNVVYLLDEPGASLHVNAQRELLSLFQHLSEKGNQVVYTTHSPYMLDLQTDGVHRIRAVVKNVEGYTYIYKTAYDARISPDSQQDTLAPIINAIGMNLNDTFGPAKDKLNIVTEGMSDYIYLCTMAKVLGIDTERYAILPSVGASNCINICSILHGWGCRYIAVFDYDTAGVKTGGEYLRKDMMFEYKVQYCYLADVSQEDVEKKTYKDSPYMIEDVVTREEINRYCAETNTSSTIGKTLMAKLMSNAIESGSYQVGEECKSNFEALFNRIFSYFNK